MKDNAMLWIIGLVLVVVLSVWIWAAHEEGKLWRAFAEAHSCKVVGKMSGDTAATTGFGVMPNGQVGPVFGTTHMPGKTGYLCDDGVTYWR